MGVEIDALPAAISLDGSEIVPIVQGGTTKRTTVGAIAAQTTPDLDTISSTQGAVVYRGATAWSGLSPGISGQFLITGGAAANPSWSTTLGAANGGTGLTSYAVGDVLYASASTTLSKLAGVATGNALISGGVTTAPSWGKIGLTTHVDGTLPVANGGTALTAGTSGGVLAYTGTGVLASSAALAANQIVLGGGAGVVPATLGSLGTTTTVLHGNAAGAPTFGAVSLTADVSGTLPVANGGTGIASYTIGDILYASGATTLAALADIATGNALISGGIGAAPSWGKVALTTHVSGTLPVANGGTGLTAGTSGGVLAYTATGTLASSAALAANQIVLGGGAGVVPATLGSLETTTTVLHGNAAGAPTFGAVSLTADITGTLTVANGGTGASTLAANGVLYGNDTSAVQVTAQGAANTVLTANAGAPAFSATPTIGGQTWVGYGTNTTTGLVVGSSTSLGNADIRAELNPSSTGYALFGCNSGAASYGCVIGWSPSSDMGGLGVAGMTIRTVTSNPILFQVNNSTNALIMNAAGSIIIGNASGALSTSATDGFLYIPTCAGTPSGTPTSITGTKPIVYDTTNNKLYLYNGAWKSVTLT